MGLPVGINPGNTEVHLRSAENGRSPEGIFLLNILLSMHNSSFRLSCASDDVLQVTQRYYYYYYYYYFYWPSRLRPQQKKLPGLGK